MNQINQISKQIKKYWFADNKPKKLKLFSSIKTMINYYSSVSDIEQWNLSQKIWNKFHN